MKVGVASSCRADALVEPARLVVGLDGVLLLRLRSSLLCVQCHATDFVNAKLKIENCQKKKMSVQYKAVSVAGRSNQALDYSKDPPPSIRTLIIVTATAGFEAVCQ